MQLSPRPIPRRKIPSLRKHGLSAVLLLAILASLLTLWIQYDADRAPAPVPVVEIPLTQNSVKPKPSAAAPLPDLLDVALVPLDANPTETIELLGGPENNAPIAGPRPPSATTPAQSGPKTIYIDGQPVGGPSQSPGQGQGQNRGQGLISAPIQGLSRMTPYGPIPAIDSKGRTALSAYARPFTPTPGKSQIAIVVGGLGINPVITKRAITELPPQISLSFVAQANDLQSLIDLARAYGHEVLIELPMEGGTPSGNEPEARYTLSTQNPDSENIRNLDKLLSRAAGYFAVTNYGGDILINDQPRMGAILAQLKTIGLGFVYDGGSSDQVLNSIAKPTQIKMATANSYLDDISHDANTVVARLNALPTNAHPAIGMGFSYPGTLDGIQKWLPTMSPSLELAPVSYALLKQ